MAYLQLTAVLFALSSISNAQIYGGPYGGGGYPGYGGNGNGNGNNGDDDGNNFPGLTGFDRGNFFSSQRVMVLAHAVMACVAFAFLFPIGGIMIRLGSFRGLWIVHGIFQIFAYLLYVAAFAIGVYMAANLDLMTEPHVILGIVLFVLLFFQPLSGYFHHVGFKREQRRTAPSYAHVWLGRAIITAGIVNGGLGLQLAQKLPFARPTLAHMIGYSVGAGIMWLLYMFAAALGEYRRGRNLAAANAPKPSSSSAASSKKSQK